MSTANEYTITDLADLAGITPRTVRYYVELGLLPPPGQVGPGARYGEGHLARLRLIRDLQRKHLPLAEIRLRLESLDDTSVRRLIAEEAAPPPTDSALDYIRDLLAAPSGGSLPPAGARPAHPGPGPLASGASPAIAAPESTPAIAAPAIAAPAAPAGLRATEAPARQPGPGSEPRTRSQWERVVLAPDIELHFRRPLGRLQSRRVERLITIASELLEEDQP